MYKYNLNEYRLSPFRKGDLENYAPFSFEHEFKPVPIYSSYKVEQKLIEIIENDRTTRPYTKILEKLIEEKKIIMGYMEPGKFRFLFKNALNIISLITPIKGSNAVLGWYIPKYDRIYIILDDNVDLIGNERFSISGVILHELCHMASYHSRATRFLTNNKKDINNFYNHFISEYIQYINNKYNLDNSLKLTSDLNLIESTITNPLHEYELNFFSLNPQERTNEFLKIWSVLFNDYPKEDRIEYTKPLIHFAFNSRKSERDIIHKILIDSYKKTQGVTSTIHSYVYQELMAPSEIIAISNQNGFKNGMRRTMQNFSRI